MKKTDKTRSYIQEMYMSPFREAGLSSSASHGLKKPKTRYGWKGTRKVR